MYFGRGSKAVQFVKKSQRPTFRLAFLFFAWNEKQRLGQLDILGSGAFGATTFGVGHSLTFTKLVVAYAVEARGVKKHVFAGTGVNKSETLVCQTLDSAFRH